MEFSLHSRKLICSDPTHAQTAVFVAGHDMLYLEIDVIAGFGKQEPAKDANAQEQAGNFSPPAAIAPHAHATAVDDDRAGQLQHVLLHEWRKRIDRFAKRPLKRPADLCVFGKGRIRGAVTVWGKHARFPFYGGQQQGEDDGPISWCSAAQGCAPVARENRQRSVQPNVSSTAASGPYIFERDGLLLLMFEAVFTDLLKPHVAKSGAQKLRTPDGILMSRHHRTSPIVSNTLNRS